MPCTGMPCTGMPCIAAVAAATTASLDALEQLAPWLEENALGPGHAVLLGPQAYHGAFVRYLGLAACALGRHDDAKRICEETLAEVTDDRVIRPIGEVLERHRSTREQLDRAAG